MDNVVHDNQGGGDGAGRSWTLTDIPSSSAWPQWLQPEGKWFTTWSSLSERHSVFPLQPFWPHGFRSFPLSRFGAGGFPRPSLEGGGLAAVPAVQARISPRPAWPWSASIPAVDVPAPVLLHTWQQVPPTRLLHLLLVKRGDVKSWACIGLFASMVSDLRIVPSDQGQQTGLTCRRSAGTIQLSRILNDWVPE